MKSIVLTIIALFLFLSPALCQLKRQLTPSQKQEVTQNKLNNSVPLSLDTVDFKSAHPDLRKSLQSANETSTVWSMPHVKSDLTLRMRVAPIDTTMEHTILIKKYHMVEEAEKENEVKNKLLTKPE